MEQPSGYEVHDDGSTDSFQDDLNDDPLNFAESVRDSSRGKSSHSVHKCVITSCMHF